ncbi:MAG: hypothetical protein JWM84_2716 [Nocardioides sp.]|jgi:hypothetical protein|nr:hypothetical protein [Nocardioides sp.]
MSEEPPLRRARHLMDPSQPRPAVRREDVQRLERVQKWVLSILIVTTILHLSAGLAIAAQYVDEDALSAGIGLSVLAGAFGVIAVAAGLGIHKRPMASPWLVLGVVPGIVSAYLVLR